MHIRVYWLGKYADRFTDEYGNLCWETGQDSKGRQYLRVPQITHRYMRNIERRCSQKIPRTKDFIKKRQFLAPRKAAKLCTIHGE